MQIVPDEETVPDVPKRTPEQIEQDLADFQWRLDMYKSACAFLVRELGGGEVFVPAWAFDTSGAVGYKIENEGLPIEDRGIRFVTFTEAPPSKNH
jgi:hypothetical protein